MLQNDSQLNCLCVMARLIEALAIIYIFVALCVLGEGALHFPTKHTPHANKSRHSLVYFTVYCAAPPAST